MNPMKTPKSLKLRHLITAALVVLALAGLACQPAEEDATVPTETDTADAAIQELLGKYTTFRLEADLSALSENERQMIPLLVEAAQAMDEAFWIQAYGDKGSLLGSLDDAHRRFAEINYGPWDRLNGNEPFVDGVGPKPKGANLYPEDASAEAIEAAAEENPALLGLYTLVRRDDACCPPESSSPSPTARPSPSFTAPPPKSSAPPPSWPRTPGSSATSSCAPRHSSPTNTVRATSPGWT